MKQAKKRPLPTLAKLISSTKRTNKAMTSALASIAASNRRIVKKEKRAAVKALGKLMNSVPPNSAERIRERQASAPRRKRKYKLEDMLAQIPPGTRFEEFDVGPPVGKETL